MCLVSHVAEAYGNRLKIWFVTYAGRGQVFDPYDIAKEKSKGGVFAKRAQFAENARKWNHPGKGKR